MKTGVQLIKPFRDMGALFEQFAQIIAKSVAMIYNIYENV
jgi:hypothetical protein